MESVTIHLNLHPLNLLIISGIIQLLVMGGILFFQRKTEPIANRLLAMVVIISAFHFSWYMILDTNLDQIASANLLRFWFSFLLAIGPLLYLYTAVLTLPNFRIGRDHLVHFAPVLVELILQTMLAVYSIVNGQHIYQSSLYVFFKMFELICTGVSIVFYVKKSLLLIRNYQQTLIDHYSDHSHLTLQWLNGLVHYLRVLWIFWIAFECCFILFWHFQLHVVPVYVILYVLMIVTTYSIYWIGIKGFQASGSLSEKRFPLPQKLPAANYYAKTDTAEVNRIVAKLERAMKEDRLYRNENLSLQSLAEEIEENPNLISYVLNNSMNESFYDYVNGHRVEEVKMRMVDPRYAHLKLVEVAFDCGFNSKATFNRAFKKVTGVSPTVYRDGSPS